MYTQAAFLIALGGVAVAQQTINGGIGGSSSNCPDGWSSNQIGDSSQVYCCPGSAIQINDEGSCCIGVGTMGPRGTCGTTVAYSDPNYSSIVSSLAAQTGDSSSPMTNSDSTATADSSSSMATSAASSSSAGTTAASGSSSGSESGSSAAAQTSASSSSSAAGVAITAGPMLANILMGAAGAAMLL